MFLLLLCGSKSISKNPDLKLRHYQKNAKEETGFTLPKVIEIGYDNGLVESKTINIDKTWSAMKFTFPKDGKVYQNSYGKLKS